MTVPPDKSPDRITPGKAMEPPETRIAPQPPRGDFQSHMQGAPAAPSQPAAPGGPTPLDLARQSQMQTAGPSFNSILAQAKNAQDSLGTVGDQLKTPNLKLRRSQTHLVKNKLTDASPTKAQRYFRLRRRHTPRRYDAHPSQNEPSPARNRILVCSFE